MLLLDDITEREELVKEVQRIERQLASVVESANDLIISTDPSGSIVTWNPAAERISGFSSAEVIGQELTRFFPDEQQLSLRTLLRRLTRGKPVDSAELTLVTRDGKEIPIYWTFSTMKDDQGRVSGIVAVGRDLTERRKFEEQLIEQAKMASLGVMAGGIAHELRNPLGISSAAAQLLLDGKSSEKMRRQCARKIYEGIHRASQIIENLLKFAHPPKEKIAKVDVNEALNEALSLLPAQTKPQQVKIRLKLDPSIPPVMANKELLQQVFINMILNAFSVVPSGGQLTIQTGWTKRPRNSSELHIRFKDTGFGIPRQNLSRIFDPFFTTMPAGKGTGLGLSICYSIVRQHGGAIEVESEVGKGTTFTIRLPFERQPKGNRHEEDALRTGIEGKAVHPHSG